MTQNRYILSALVNSFAKKGFNLFDLHWHINAEEDLIGSKAFNDIEKKCSKILLLKGGWI